MKINEFIKNNLKVTNLAKNKDLLRCVKPIHLKNENMMTSTRLPQIVCVDGFKMSVQVGFSLYSTPKKVAKRYSAVEIGFPSEHEPLIEEFAERVEDEIDYTDTVYPYVPVKVVDKVLKKHGGIDLTETLSKV
jgi:hypothetical protein